MKFRLLFVFCLLVLSQIGYSQTKMMYGAAANNYLAGSQQLRLASPKEAPRFIRFDVNGTAKPLSSADWKRALQLPQATELRKIAAHPGASASRDVLQQYHHGYPVEGAVYYLHYTTQRQLTAANGQLWKQLPDQASAGISEQQAVEQAMLSKHFAGAATAVSSEKTVLLFAPVRTPQGEIVEHRLSYKVEVSSKDPYRKAWVYIDAANGKELYSLNQIHETNTTGTAHTRYSGQRQIGTKHTGTEYLLRDYTKGSGINTLSANNNYDFSYLTDITDGDNTWNETTNFANAAYDAHWGAMKTYDYYKNTFNRNSFDGQGAAINVVVHFGSMYDNAFWDGQSMAFGDGSNTSGGFSPLTSIDVVAHEFTHAVTEYSANLVYAYESGALNESFSDIFGTVVEYYAKPQVANYLIGEEVSVGGGALRSMINPNDYYNPDTYGGTYYVTGSEDNGGVHSNSGVQNYWFYLLAQGGSGTNDLNNTFTVEGIGMSKAAAIAYRNLTTYLTPNSTFEDAAFYAIRSAEDLYGLCSTEARATAQAWYAVGVISAPSFETTAAFSASQTYSCSTQTDIVFTNESQWASSYLWNFGDGTTSTETSPTHRYTTAGTYTVSLTANPGGACGTAPSTVTKNAYITVENGSTPVASCTPHLVETCCSVGITQVQLGSASFTTTEWENGYNNYTCQSQIELIQGARVNMQVATRYEYGELLQAFIDWNNNGSFENSERIYTSGTSLLLTHSTTFVVPTSAVIDQPLRLRVRSTALDTAPNGSCDNISYGEVQDYTVRIQQNTQPPVANFTLAGAVAPNADITFQDNSEFVPTSWAWTFEGASIASSSVQNPVVRFSQPGTYRVSLTATNAFGSHTTSRDIAVYNELIFCQDTQSTNASGVLYDSGGKDGNYSNYENCTFTFPGCSNAPVQLNVIIHGMERGYDFLTVYDGQNSSAPVLFYSGNSTQGSFTANSGSFYVTFTSDYSVISSGFEISWSQQGSTDEPPVAAFDVNDENPPLNTPVYFTNTSQQSGSYHWDFGDGNTSTEANPTYQYSQPGTYEVVLTASNCVGTVTATHTITVQEAPVAEADTQVRTIRLKRNETYNLPITISNTGEGALSWEYLNDLPQIITVWRNNTENTYLTQILYNTNAYILDYYGEGYDMSLAEALAISSTLVLPRYYGSQQDIQAAKAEIDAFVERGGILIIAGQESNVLNTLDYFRSSSYDVISSGTLTRATTNHPLLNNISSDIQASYYTYVHTFSNASEFQKVLTYQQKTVAAVKAVGNGYAIYLGSDYWYYNAQLATLLQNAATAYSYPSASWISMNQNTGRVEANSSATLNTVISSYNLSNGEYKGALNLWTNDTENSLLKSKINLIVTDQAVQDFSWQAVGTCGGTYSFNNESTLSNSRSFHWDFGDGETSTNVFPEHTYDLPGTYAVTLTINENGTSTKVNKNVTANFLAAAPVVPDSALVRYPVLFKAEIKGDYTNLTWDFGDGYSAVITNPEHSFATNGEYLVRLRVNSSTGCEMLYEKKVVVGNFPALGLDELPASELALYPNPTRGKLNLKLPAGEWQLTLSDQLGRKVHTTTLRSVGSTEQLNVADLPKGLYILHVANGKQQAYRKLQIQ